MSIHIMTQSPEKRQAEEERQQAELEYQIAWERSVCADVREACEVLVDAAKPVWHLSDGQGGFMVDELIQAIENAGLAPINQRWLRRAIDPNSRATSLRATVLERDAYRCRLCGDWHNLQVDHIHPASKGGLTTLDNLQTLCAPCNAQKGARV